jgi:DNA-binding transcriptional regulator YiaG
MSAMDKAEVKRIRKRLGLSQEAFARVLNVSWITVNRWESGEGEAHISPENAEKIVTLSAKETK